MPRARQKPRPRTPSADRAAKRDAVRTVTQPGKSALGKIGANPQNALLAEETLTLAAIVGYDLRGGQKKLPSPGPIMAGLGFFAILSLVGSFGAQAARVSVLVGAVLTATVLVTGVRGKSIVDFISKLAGQGNVGSAAVPGVGPAQPNPLPGWQ